MALGEEAALRVFREIPEGAVDCDVATDAGEPAGATATTLDAPADGSFLHPVEGRPEVVGLILPATYGVELEGEVSELLAVVEVRVADSCSDRVELQLLSRCQFDAAPHVDLSGQDGSVEAEPVGTFHDPVLDRLDVTDVADRDALERAADHNAVGADEAVDASEQLEGGSAVVAVDHNDLWAELTDRLVTCEGQGGSVASVGDTCREARLGDRGGLDLPAVLGECVHRVRCADRGELFGGGVGVAGCCAELDGCDGVVHGVLVFGWVGVYCGLEFDGLTDCGVAADCLVANVADACFDGVQCFSRHPGKWVVRANRLGAVE